MFGIPYDEIKRKTFHILTLIYVFAYYFMQKNIVVYGLVAALIIVLIGEYIRSRNEKFNVFILKVLGGVHRKSEEHKISGLPWTLLGALITICLFQDKNFVLASFLYLSFGDAAAALIGKTFGRHKIYAGKSLEGTFACFVVCFIIGLIVLPTWQFALIGGICAAFIETIPWPLNDNFWLQILNAGILTFVGKIF